MNEPGKVFISYAWDNEEHKERVRVFAVWLDYQLKHRGHEKSEILIDLNHSITPPPEGWQPWMYNSIKFAETVLIICSQKYFDSYNKLLNGTAGRGATYEGAIINQSLYTNYQQNTKFFPILYDNEKIETIPEILLQWWNNLRFPSSNENIFRLLLRENPTLNPQQVKEELKEIAEEIKQEERLITELFQSIDPTSQKMLKPIQTLVRVFVTLSDVQKIVIAKKLGLYSSSLNSMKSSEIDKELLRKVKEKSLLHQLWEEVNNTNPIDMTNPF